MTHYCQSPAYAELLLRAYGIPTRWIDGVPYQPRRWTDRRWLCRLPLRGWESVGAPKFTRPPGYGPVRLPRFQGDLHQVGRCEAASTHLIDLQDWRPSAGVRKAIRRAKKQGIHVRQIEDINDWRANYLPLVGPRGALWSNRRLLHEVQWQYSLGQHVYFVAEATLYISGLVYGAPTLLTADGVLSGTLSTGPLAADVRAVAGLGFYHHDGVATEVLSRATYRRCQAQEALHVACFEAAKRLDCHTFDLCPGGTPGIEQFKSKFGGRTEEVITAWA